MIFPCARSMKYMSLSARSKLIIPASALKEVVRILGATKADQVHPLSTVHRKPGGAALRECANCLAVDRREIPGLPGDLAERSQNQDGRQYQRTAQSLQAGRHYRPRRKQRGAVSPISRVLNRPGKSSCWPNRMKLGLARSSSPLPLKVRNWRSPSM